MPLCETKNVPATFTCGPLTIAYEEENKQTLHYKEII